VDGLDELDRMDVVISVVTACQGDRPAGVLELSRGAPATMSPAVG
jgi:hypothetical protein